MRHVFMRSSGAVFLALSALLLSLSIARAADAFTTGSVNMRSGPSTSYATIVTLPAGTGVAVRGCGDGWCRIVARGLEGYVAQAYLEGLSRPPPIVVGPPVVVAPPVIVQPPYYRPPYYRPPHHRPPQWDRPPHHRPPHSRPPHQRPPHAGKPPHQRPPGKPGKPGKPHGKMQKGCKVAPGHSCP